VPVEPPEEEEEPPPPQAVSATIDTDNNMAISLSARTCRPLYVVAIFENLLNIQYYLLIK
jgi:hypothetical protein